MKVHVCVRRAGSDDEVKCNSKTDAILSQMDAGDLTEQIIGRYQSTFSKNEDDIGFCDLVRKQLAQQMTNQFRKNSFDFHNGEYHRTSGKRYGITFKSHLTKASSESSSPFASPIVLFRKRDGKLRLCVDYRLLNAKTHEDVYPLLRINEALDVLKGGNRGTQRQFSENICSEDDLRSRIFGTFVVTFLACLPLLGFSNI